MAAPRGAMSTSNIWDSGVANQSWTEIADKALGEYTDKHNKEQCKYDRKPEVKAAEPVTLQEHIEQTRLTAEPQTIPFIQDIRQTETKFSEDLKQEFIKAIVLNDCKLIEMSDFQIIFENKGKRFILLPL